MWLYSNTITWIPVVVCFIFILFYTNRTRWREILLVLVVIVLVITLCDQFASSFCKPFFARFRPTHHPDFMNDVKTVFDYRSGNYGFISSHAANGFGFATVTSLIFRNKIYSVSLFLWATVSAYSRIYLGVHFISDIIPGILVGLFFGWIGYQLFVIIHKKSFARLNPNAALETPDSDQTLPDLKIRYAYKGLPLVLCVLLATVVLLAIWATISKYN